VVAELLDAVGVSPSSFDDPRVDSVTAAGVEFFFLVMSSGDLLQDGPGPVRGSRADGPEHDPRSALELDLVRSVPVLVAAAQIRTLIA